MLARAEQPHASEVSRRIHAVAMSEEAELGVPADRPEIHAGPVGELALVERLRDAHPGIAGSRKSTNVWEPSQNGLLSD